MHRGENAKRMKKTLFTSVFGSVLLMLCFSAVADEDEARNYPILNIELTPKEQAFVRNNPLVTLTDDASHRPYLFKNENGQHRGYIMDLLKIIEANTGLRFEIINLPLRRALREVRAKNVDGVAITAVEDIRNDIFDYSAPYLTGHMAIFTKAGNAEKFQTLQDLNGKRIVITNSSVVLERFAESIPYVQIMVVDSSVQLIQALTTGKADYAYYPEVLNVLNQSQVEPLVEPAFLTGNVIDLRFATRKDKPELGSIINKVLAALTVQETSQLETKWLDPRYFSKLDDAVNLTSEELAYLQKRVGIRFCVNSNGGVISEITDGPEVTGMAADFMELIKSKLASKFVLHPTESWQATLEALRQGACDLSPVIINTPSRREFLTFSSPYLSDPAVMVTKKGRFEDFQLAQHLQEKYAVTKGYALIEQLLALYPDLNLTEVDTTAQCLAAVENSSVNGCVALFADAANHIYELNMTGLEFHHRLGFSAEIRIGIRKSEALLATIMQKTLNKLGRDDIQLLQSRYLTNINEPKTKRLNQLFYVGLFILIVMLVALVSVLLKTMRGSIKRSQSKLSESNHELALMREITDGCEQSILVVAPRTAEITYLNEYGCTSLGYQLQPSLTLTLYDIDTQLTEDMWQAVLLELEQTDHVLVRAAYKNKLAFVFPTELIYRKVNIAGNTRIVVYVTDISSRIRIENDLNQSKQDVDNAIALKNTFLGEIGTEVRMPTEFIINTAELALQTRLGKSQKEYVERVKLAAESISTTLDDIQDYSLLTDGKLSLNHQEFDLLDLIDSLVARYEFQVTQKGLEMLSHCASGLGRYYVGDVERLKQVLTKLIQNAIKHTDSGQIVIQVSESEDDRIRFGVKDTGPGMDKDAAEHFFEEKEFHTDTLNHSTIELSLSLAKKLVALMDGEIWVESVQGFGSEFIIDVFLPRATDLLTVAEFEQKSVLVVDDNPVCQQLLQEQLKHFNLQVEVAESGQKALHLVNEFPTKYDLILMDWSMPDLNGLETAQLMHQQYRVDHSMADYEPPTVIMVSAHDQSQMVKEARDVGVPLFLPKPIDPSSLFDVLVKVLVRTDRYGDQPHRRNEVIQKLKQQLFYKNAKRVLLAEDNRINQEIVVGILEGCNIDIEIANNGQEAVELFNPDVHELVLMDLQMPIMDGFEATRIIREQNPQVPIVALTANVMPEHVKRTQALGMNAHLGKPVNIEKLYQILIEHLGEQESDAEATQTHEHSESTNLPIFNSINTHKGMIHFVNNTNLYRSALVSFAAKYRNLDFEGLSTDEQRQAIHAIKGLSDNIGADKLQHAVMEFEFNNETSAKAYFLSELKVVTEEISRHLEALKSH